MVWEVEYTDEFGTWWGELTEAEQESIEASVVLLEEYGAIRRAFAISAQLGNRRFKARAYA